MCNVYHVKMNVLICAEFRTPHETACLLSRGVVWKKFTGQTDFQLYHSISHFSPPGDNEPIFSGVQVK
ncbi:Hydroxymethylglutaryl-CoA synthase, mitochondrial [Frankliniella fusca]|uniref:Hydroxymethylglutaryl-CoA synthase, mitochondrial n=1 Tax=Frankliniella fusca TaxID=407009 RepID=A0AAE1GZQ6_9NEOP|nr:Hydroxymethylglutaryl-CoA synthase, mitochondrial [Frankliniella fusca]